VSTYEIPDEPDVDVLWGPTPDGEGWVKYVRRGYPESARGTWWRPADKDYGGFWWSELLLLGPLTDEDPEPGLEVLGQRVIDAAVTKVQWDDPQTWNALKEAVRKYNEKKGTT
jgi:hypothetical protein